MPSMVDGVATPVLEPVIPLVPAQYQNADLVHTQFKVGPTIVKP